MSFVREAGPLRHGAAWRQIISMRKPQSRTFGSCQSRRLQVPKPEDMKLRVPPRLLSEVDSKGQPIPRKAKGMKRAYPKFPKYRFMLGLILIPLLVYDMVNTRTELIMRVYRS